MEDDNIPEDPVELVRIRLEQLGLRGKPFAIVDNDLIDDAGQEEVYQLAHLLTPDELVVLVVPVAVQPIVLPVLAHDHCEILRAGRALVIFPVAVENREANAAHRPDDTQPVKAAKIALAAQAFRLLAAQKAVELARNNRARELTEEEIEERAKEAIGEAVWRDGRDPDGIGKARRLRGLIDRGRRQVAQFFGVEKPRDVGHAEADRIADRLGTSLPGSAERKEITANLDRDHREQARGLADHELRAVSHERAMAQWAASVREGRPIDVVDGRAVTNGNPTRQPAHALMRVAIDGDLNPADVHRNIETMREAFEVGRLIGQLSRGRSIELMPGHAELLIVCLHVFASQLHGSGKPETEADGCAWYLADAALRCHDLGSWNRIIARILETGTPETIEPRIP